VYLDLGVDKDMDMSERGYDGLAIFDFLAENHCEAKIIVISGMGKEKIEVTANIGREMKLDVIGAITKPFSIDKIDQLLLNLKR
jgi:DNA-binding NtrC family response regulator